MKRSLNWLRNNITGLVAPLVLALVATGHLVVANSGSQSPWKGGGFGMFSTIVSPASRVVKARLHTESGPVAIQIPGEFGKQEGRIRTLPTQAAVDELARSIGAKAWAPVSMVPVQQQYDALSKRVPETDDIATDLNDMLARMNMLRMLGDDEPKEQAIPLKGVEVICYQVDFDAAGKRLTLSPLVRSYLDLDHP